MPAPPEAPVPSLAIRLEGDIREVAKSARVAEATGFESCWVTESDQTAVVAATTAIVATERIKVGTGVALAFPRSPTITAMTSWDLGRLSGDRFLLGLGSQVKRINELRFGVPFAHPAPKLKEYVEAMRVIWRANRGEDVVHEGRFYQLTMPRFCDPPEPDRPDVPVLIAAVGPVMSRACGEVAEGAIAHSLASPAFIRERMAPQVRAGLERAGRAPDACPITAGPIVAVSDDADRARGEAKLQIAFWATTRSYRPILEVHGREHLTDPLRSAYAEDDRARMIGLIDDELCDAIALAGTPEEVMAGISRWQGVADRVIVGSPRFGMSGERLKENHEALLRTFGQTL